jgi:hypothetical protein
MTDFRDLLRDKATESVAGERYQELRRRRSVERESSGRGDDALYYEVLVPPAGAWETFREAVFPPYARWLRAHRLDLAAPRGVVVAAFLGERCHLLDGERFLDVLSEMDGLNASALHFRVLRWVR